MRYVLIFTITKIIVLCTKRNCENTQTARRIYQHGTQWNVLKPREGVSFIEDARNSSLLLYFHCSSSGQTQPQFVASKVQHLVTLPRLVWAEWPYMSTYYAEWQNSREVWRGFMHRNSFRDLLYYQMPFHIQHGLLAFLSLPISLFLSYTSTDYGHEVGHAPAVKIKQTYT